jgi:hypothetical protein
VALARDHSFGVVEVTYGTSRYGPREKPHELHVYNASEMEKCGLPQATCFILGRTVKLLWGPDYFCKREDGTGPVIGHLSPTVLMQLEALKVQRRQNGY